MNSINFSNRFICVLDYLEENCGINQRQFAEKLGVTPSHISKIKKGGTVSESLLKNICRTFGISENWIKTGDGEMLSKPRIPSIGDPIEPSWYPHGTVPAIGDTSEGTKGTKLHVPAIGEVDVNQQEKYAFAIIRNSQGWDAEEIVRSLTKLPRSVRSRILSEMFAAIEEEDAKKRKE